MQKPIQSGVYSPPDGQHGFFRSTQDNIPWSSIHICTILHIITTSAYIFIDYYGLMLPADPIVDEINNQWHDLPASLKLYAYHSYWPEVTLLLISWILILLKKRIGLYILTGLIALWWSWQLVDIDDATAGGYRFILHGSLLSEGAIIALFLHGLFNKKPPPQESTYEKQ